MPSGLPIDGLSKDKFFSVVIWFFLVKLFLTPGEIGKKPDQAALEQLADDKKFLRTHHQLVETGLPKNEEHLRSVFPRK